MVEKPTFPRSFLHPAIQLVAKVDTNVLASVVSNCLVDPLPNIKHVGEELERVGHLLDAGSVLVATIFLMV